MIKIICEFCGKNFWIYPSRKNTAKYCSNSCKTIDISLKKQRFEFRTQPIFSSRECAYLAGIIDGEGYISESISKGKSHSYVMIGITNTSKELFDWISEYIKGPAVYRINKNKRLGSKQAFEWRITNRFGCYQLLKLIYPYLVIKKQKAKCIIKLLEKYHFERFDSS